MKRRITLIIFLYLIVFIIGVAYFITWKSMLFYPHTFKFDKDVFVIISTEEFKRIFLFNAIWGLVMFFIMTIGLIVLYTLHEGYLKELYKKIMNNIITPENADDEIKPLIEYVSRMKKLAEENDMKVKELTKEVYELKELEDFKSRILANVSHELRSPLTTIKGYVEYILNGNMGELNSSQEKGLSVVFRSIKRLEKQINMLIAFAKKEKRSLNYELFTMQKLLEEIKMEYILKMKEKNLSFNIKVPKDMHPVLADRDAMKEVIENLLTNAIKFTPENGMIEIEAREITEKDGSVWVELKVKDTGIGIPKEKQKLIFERFYQIEQSDKRKYEGIGLGLPIVKEIVESHGGTITLDSKVGEGSTFTIKIPMYQRGGTNG